MSPERRQNLFLEVLTSSNKTGSVENWPSPYCFFPFRWGGGGESGQIAFLEPGRIRSDLRCLLPETSGKTLQLPF